LKVFVFDKIKSLNPKVFGIFKKLESLSICDVDINNFLKENQSLKTLTSLDFCCRYGTKIEKWYL
jgi:hypothetical protein